MMRIRFGQFNIRDFTQEKLRKPEHPQVTSAAAVIKKVRPDVLSINEIEAVPEAPPLFRDHYLGRGDDPLHYPYYYAGPTNSGIPTGLPPPFDLRGFGLFERQYGIALFSRFPIQRDGVRSFEDFPWRGLPSGLSCLGDRTTEVPEGFPLFSTNLLDVPIRVKGRSVHAVLLHASVPLKGPLNRERNGDQLKFLNEYISGRALPGAAPFPEGEPFVLMGDFNADPEKGEGITDAIQTVLENPSLKRLVPSMPTFLDGGGVESPALDPGGFGLKLDYILPSRDFSVLKHEVFRPGQAGEWRRVRLASDHFMVYADCVFD